jgi:ferredoxin
MNNAINPAFESWLNGFSENDWLSTIESIINDVHEVDRNAVRIWMRFFPLELHRFLQSSEDPAEARRRFVVDGIYDLKGQADSSHHFLYGHRYWKSVKEAIADTSRDFAGEGQSLSSVIQHTAGLAAESSRTTKDLTIGISAVGLMTLVQVGAEAFQSSPGDTAKPRGIMAKSPNAIVAERKKDDSQGLLGFLRTVDKQWSVNWMTSSESGRFKIFNDQEIASAAASDQSQNWSAKDQRCIEGVIPVECRSASCGTCWVGVLGGEEKLSEVAPRERKQVKLFGYKQPEEPKPYIRLACQAKATGNVSIVIPPWNGVFGKKVYGGVEESELIPATTSAQKNREIVKEAANSKGNA